MCVITTLHFARNGPFEFFWTLREFLEVNKFGPVRDFYCLLHYTIILFNKMITVVDIPNITTDWSDKSERTRFTPVLQRDHVEGVRRTERDRGITLEGDFSCIFLSLQGDG